jgi:hypothetical protein
MKTFKVKDAFYIATAPYNREIVIIADVGEYGCLKVLANSNKYFNAYFPDFKYFNGKTLKVLTKTFLKSFFTKALKQDPTYFSMAELEKLGEYFNIKIEKHLSEQLKIKFNRSKQPWHKDHNNYNKAEKWERTPAKRKTPARNVVKKAKTTTKRKTTAKRK